MTDFDRVLRIARWNFGMAAYTASTPDIWDKVSFFGADIPGRWPAPANLCVHATLVTADGYVLLARRSGDVSVFEHAWSATFEEQVDLWTAEHDDPEPPDRTVADTFHRGIRQECHDDLRPHHIAEETCTAIGLEWMPDEPSIGPAIAAVAAGLPLDLQDFWDLISEKRRRLDSSESAAWAAVPFRSLDDAAQLLSIDRAGVANIEYIEGVLNHEDDAPPRADARWHPSSRQRLFLMAEWLRLH